MYTIYIHLFLLFSGSFIFHCTRRVSHAKQFKTIEQIEFAFYHIKWRRRSTHYYTLPPTLVLLFEKRWKCLNKVMSTRKKRKKRMKRSEKVTTTTKTLNEYANNPFCCSICYWCCFQTHLITNHVMESVNSVHAVQLCFLPAFFIAFSHFLCVFVWVNRLWLYGFALTHSVDAVRGVPSSSHQHSLFIVRACERMSVVLLLLFPIQISVSIYQNVHDD